MSARANFGAVVSRKPLGLTRALPAAGEREMIDRQG
jgi:hypothetical protein